MAEHETEQEALAEPDYCDHCGGAVTGGSDVIECDGWTCRADAEADDE